MNENINLVEILKDCPKGTKLYCTVYGEVTLYYVNLEDKRVVVKTDNHQLNVENIVFFLSDGRLLDEDEECVLFPSRGQRDWIKWVFPKPKKPKFDPMTLNPFDKVLRRCKNIDIVWSCDFFSHLKNRIYVCSGCISDYVIPYNDYTKHLVGTTKEAPEYYRYWEE